MAAILHVVVLRQRRDHCCSVLNLTDPVQDDFRSPVIKLHVAVDFDGAAGEAPNVADILQVAGKDDHCERACDLVFAEIEEMDATLADLYAQDLTGHALCFADVLAGFVDRDTVGM